MSPTGALEQGHVGKDTILATPYQGHRSPFLVMWAIMVMIIAITQKGGSMRTVQMTLDEDLVAAVDRAARRLGTTRSGFTREALNDALRKLRIKEMERRHREGYARKPVKRGEFSVWETEHAWGGE